MKTFLIIIGVINLIYYSFAIIGKLYGNDEDEMPLNNVNIFTQIAVIIFFILVGFIPIVNFFIATKILYKEIMQDIF